MEKTIDYVFPYVDCDDPSWIEEYNKYAPKKKTVENRWAVDMSRFRANDLLKYTFRSIEKNMPFIRKIHFIVMSESQIPSWLDREKVHVVFHKDFIPEEYLPTFNSNTIESFLSNIPGISDRFIYGNDDLFITSKCEEKDFFSGNVPKYTMEKRKYIPTAPGDGLRYDDKKLITGKDDKTVYEVQHICMPYVMDTLKEVYEKYKDRIEKSIGKFRERGQYNQWIYSIYQALNKKFINKGIKHLSTEIRPSLRGKYLVDWSRFKAICLNDSYNTTQTDLKLVKEKLERMFPSPSKFEKKKKKTVLAKPKPEEKPKAKPAAKTTKLKKDRPDGKTWNTFFDL